MPARNIKTDNDGTFGEHARTLTQWGLLAIAADHASLERFEIDHWRSGLSSEDCAKQVRVMSSKTEP